MPPHPESMRAHAPIHYRESAKGMSERMIRRILTNASPYMDPTWEQVMYDELYVRIVADQLRELGGAP